MTGPVQLVRCPAVTLSQSDARDETHLTCNRKGGPPGGFQVEMQAGDIWRWLQPPRRCFLPRCLNKRSVGSISGWLEESRPGIKARFELDNLSGPLLKAGVNALVAAAGIRILGA